jgi:hypothetical protein
MSKARPVAGRNGRTQEDRHGGTHLHEPLEVVYLAIICCAAMAIYALWVYAGG